MKKEHEEDIKSKQSNNFFDDTAEIDLISRNAGYNTIFDDEYDDIMDTSVTTPITAYEDDTEYFEPEIEDDDNDFANALLYTAPIPAPVVAEDEVSNSYEEEITNDKTENTENTKDAGKKIKMAYYMISASIIIFLLLVTFLLVVYIQVLKAGKDYASNNGSAVINGNPAIDQSYVQRIEEENNTLRKDIESLRNELANVSSSSSAQAEGQNLPSETVPLGAPEIDNDSNASENNQPTAAGTNTILNNSDSTQKPRTYVVKKGDNLQDIALAFYGDKMMYKTIKEANNLKSNVIVPSQKLIIP